MLRVLESIGRWFQDDCGGGWGLAAAIAILAAAIIFAATAANQYQTGFCDQHDATTRSTKFHQYRGVRLCNAHWAEAVTRGSDQR